MTPTEKAEEIVDKFKDHVNPYMGSGMLSNTFDDNAILWQSKKCALICVDEIIQSSPSLPLLSDNGSYGSDIELSTIYWKEVKQEINKL